MDHPTMLNIIKRTKILTVLTILVLSNCIIVSGGPADDAITYLDSVQDADGGFTDFSTSCWVANAYKAHESVPSPLAAYLSSNHETEVDINDASDVSLFILASVVCGWNPYNVDGINYVQILQDLDNGGGSFGVPNFLFDDFWPLIALSAANIQGDTTFIEQNQNPDGGWGWATGEVSDCDDTAAAIMALMSNGVPETDPSIVDALDYLANQQMPDGGFPSWGESNADTDSWCISAIISCGQDPSTWGNNPVEHLESLQQPDGSVYWKPGDPGFMLLQTTAKAVVALSGSYYPVATYNQPTGGDLNAISLSTYFGVYEDTVTAIGDGVPGGGEVSVYWDNGLKETFTDGSGRLNTTESEPDGSFSINFDIPEAVSGEHYIWVKDMSSGHIVRYELPLSVLPKLEVDPDSGLEGDDVTLMGYGYGDENDVELFTDNFGVAVDYGTTESDEYGTWSVTFEVPDVAYGVYTITAEDNETNTADADFTIGASITISKDIGPVGTYLRVEGRGFTEDATLDIGDIQIGEAPTWFDCWIDNDGDPVEVNSQGKFRADIVIPSAPEGEWEIRATEVGGVGATGTADFEIDEDGVAEIKVTPEYGPVGSRIDIEGWNFSQLNGEEVIVYVDGTEVDTFETDSDGHFDGTIRIPGATGTVVVDAEQTHDEGQVFIMADTNFRVGSISVILSPDEGPAGTRITLSGAGFDGADDWNATFGGDEWVDGTDIPGNGVITNSDLWAPSMEPGVYEVVVTEEDNEVSITTEFIITENTYVELSPMVAPNEYNVTIKGSYFAELPDDPDLDFILYNDTDDWDIDVFYNGDAVELELDEDWLDEDDYPTGYFEGWFEVPDD
jgi:hypothetical protein